MIRWPHIRVWLISGCVIFVVLGLILPIAQRVQVTTKDIYDLSQMDRENLEAQAIKGKNGDAAYRVALYYSRSKKDTTNWLIWIRRAAELGNRDAQRLSEYYKDVIPDAIQAAKPGSKEQETNEK